MQSCTKMREQLSWGEAGDGGRRGSARRLGGSLVRCRASAYGGRGGERRVTCVAVGRSGQSGRANGFPVRCMDIAGPLLGTVNGFPVRCMDTCRGSNPIIIIRRDPS